MLLKWIGFNLEREVFYGFIRVMNFTLIGFILSNVFNFQIEIRNLK